MNGNETARFQKKMKIPFFWFHAVTQWETKGKRDEDDQYRHRAVETAKGSK